MRQPHVEDVRRNGRVEPSTSQLPQLQRLTRDDKDRILTRHAARQTMVTKTKAGAARAEKQHFIGSSHVLVHRGHVGRDAVDEFRHPRHECSSEVPGARAAV